MTNILKRLRRSMGEGGQSIVETALVVPALATMLVGSVQMARVIYASIAVANAAKAGAQYGCQSGYTAADSTGIATAASNEAPNLTVSTTTAVACACSDGKASTCLNTDCANSHIEETLTVNTQATVAATIRLPGLPSSYTVKGQSIQRVVQ
ncbi:pilus assembly protein [Acidobacteria bacterium AB60]|nr:pilus assembly protein [Acidobacteria bacterium AB60]